MSDDTHAQLAYITYTDDVIIFTYLHVSFTMDFLFTMFLTYQMSLYMEQYMPWLSKKRRMNKGKLSGLLPCCDASEKKTIS